MIIAQKGDPKNAITILNWLEGDLGINLGLNTQASESTPLDRIGTNNDDFLITGTGYMWAGDGDDSIIAGDSNNEIYGGSGSDSIISGMGNDFIYVDNNNGPSASRYFKIDYSEGWPPSGTVGEFTTHPEWINYVDAGAGNDYVYAEYGTDIIEGGEGHDRLLGGGGADFIDGGSGDDRINGDGYVFKEFKSLGYRVFFHQDNHPAAAQLDIERLNSSYMDSNEIIIATNIAHHGDDKLYGGAGNDIIYGEGGNDFIDGGADDDIISGDAIGYRYLMYETVKDNNIVRFTEDDLPNKEKFREDLFKSFAMIAGEDELYGGSGEDYIYAGGKNDYIEGGSGKDIIYGDQDNDNEINLAIAEIYYWEAKGWVINPYIIHGDDYIDGGEDDDFVFGDGGNDIILGGLGNDHLEGDAHNNYVLGQNHGNDIIDGGEGADIIWGQGGDDKLIGGNGADQISGDANQDDLPVQWHGNDIIDGGNGNDTIWGGGGNDNVVGGAGNDHLDGGADHDYLHGGDGDDNLYGQAGDDILNGGTGNDIINGGEGDDILLGETGVDRIYGGSGHDIIEGGQGNDELVGGAGADSYIFNIGDGKDTITEQQNDIQSLNDNNYILFKFAASQASKVHRSGLDLQIDYGTSDQVTIKDYYKTRNRNNASYLDGYEQYESVEISEIRFEDGTVWSTADILQMAPPPEVNELPPDPLDGVEYFIDALVTRETVASLGKNVLTYSFPENTSSGNKIFNLMQLQAVEQALNKFAQALNIRFVKSETGNADLTFYLDDLTSADVGAAAGYASPQTGEVHINASLFENADALNQGQYGFEVLLHEIGHALGLKHPFEAPVLPIQENSQDHTIMSYTSNNNNNNDTELKIFDLAALHYLYGINADARAGDDTYTLADHYIWDGAGNDTLDASSETGNSYLNLAANSWNYVGTKSNSILAQGQSFIGHETLIENAIGGSGDDHLEGNHLNNILTGGMGHDALFGNLGDDTLLGGEGSDLLIGGQGNDILNGGQGTDTYTFNLGDGADIIVDEDGNNTVQLNGVVMEDLHYIGGVLYMGWNGEQITVDATKIATWLINGIAYSTQQLNRIFNGTVSSTAHIILDPNSPERDAQLLGQDHINAQGNAYNNVLMGNSGNNILDGGQGNDTLMGGAGDDVYIVDSINDQVIEKTNAGIDTIQSSVSVANLAENIENLTLAGNDALTGIGNHLNNIITGNSAANVLDGKLGQDVLIGGAGDDLYIVDDVLDITQENANEGTDTVQSSVDFILQDNTENLILTGAAKYGTGNALDNLIIGNDADNILEGGGGHDQIRFGHGHDTLIFKVGSGVVQLTDTTTKAGTDYRTVRFEGLTLQDVEVKQNIHGALSIKIKRTQDQLVIHEQFEHDGKVLIDNFIFSDGTQLPANTLKLLHEQELVNGSNQDDVLYGTTSQDFINGGVGNDTIDGGIGNDIIVGGSGNDELDGGGGDDILIGGAGDDVLRPGLGDDTVVFGRGSGHDVVYDSGNKQFVIDFVDMKLNEVSFYKEDIDLKAVINDTGESILIKDGLVEVFRYDLGRPQLARNQFHFADGLVSDLWIVVNVIGTDANDFIRGAYTTDIIRAGLMNDVISLTDGNDEYIYAKNDGNDIIQGVGEVDTLKFVDLSLDDILFTQQGLYDITITIRETGHVIILKNQLNYNFNGKIDKIVFADGGQLTDSQFLEMIRGTDDADGTEYIYGTSGNDHIQGMAGDDAIYSGEGNNQVEGGMGNDFIIADSGDDVFDGGVGNDTLYGGNGNNTYIYHLNGGNDIIAEGKWIDSSFYTQAYWSISNFSTLEISDLALDEIHYSFDSEQTLTVSIKSTGEMISIYHQVNQFGEYAIDNFVFNNGMTLSALDMAKSLLSGTDFDDVIYGTIESDVISGGHGNDKLVALVGEDRLFGGDGNDILENISTHYYNSGNDHNVFYGGSGDDILRVHKNNNILNGDDGNDRIDLYLSDYNIINGGAGDDVIFLTGSSHQTIVFSEVFGHDLIQSENGSYSYTPKYSLNQKIILEDLNVNEISFKLVNEFDLQIASLIDSNNSIIVESQFEYYDKLSQLQFKDGTVYTAEDIKNRL